MKKIFIVTWDDDGETEPMEIFGESVEQVEQYLDWIGVSLDILSVKVKK